VDEYNSIIIGLNLRDLPSKQKNLTKIPYMLGESKYLYVIVRHKSDSFQYILLPKIMYQVLKITKS